MNRIVFVLFTLLLLIASHVQQNSIESELNQTQEPQSIYDIFLEQQCAIQQVQTQGSTGGLEEMTKAFVSLLQPYMHWIYLTYSIVWTIFLVRQYRQQWFCYLFTIVNLIHHINNGVLYMFYCELVEGNQLKGKAFFAIILAFNIWNIIRVVSHKNYECQVAIFVAYISFFAMTALWFNGYFGIIIQLIYNFTFHLQIHSTPDKTNQGFTRIRILLAALVNFLVNLLVASYALKYPQVSMVAEDQRYLFGWQFQFVSHILGKLSSSFRRKLITKGIVRFFNVDIMKRLGFKLQTDTCVICLQEMDIFAGVFRLEDCDKIEDKDLVRLHRNHIFHKSCISSWRSTKEACPYDNEPI